MLAWAVLLLGLAALWLGIGMPIVAHVAAVRAETARLTTLAARYETETHGGDAALVRLRALANAAPEASLLVPRVTDAQSQSRLQERVKAIVAEGGAVLTGLQPQPAGNQGPWRTYPLTIQVTGDVPALQRLLHAIESERPRIAVEALQARARVASGGAATLDITVDLAAFGAGAMP
jgi:hypothetical protein